MHVPRRAATRWVTNDFPVCPTEQYTFLVMVRAIGVPRPDQRRRSRHVPPQRRAAAAVRAVAGP